MSVIDELQHHDEPSPTYGIPTPKEYKGTLFDGNARGYDNWLSTIKGSLGPVGLMQCTEEELYQGYRDGKVLLGAPFAETMRGLDTQQRLGCWLTTTLTGKAKSKIQAMASEIEANNATVRAQPEEERDNSSIRLHPSAYEVFQAVKADSRPNDGNEVLQMLMQRLQEFNLPSGCDHDKAMQWYHESLQIRNELIQRGMDNFKDDQFVVSNLLIRVKPVVTRDDYKHLERSCKSSLDKSYTVIGFEQGLNDIFPLGLCAQPAVAGGAINFQGSGTRSCKHCVEAGRKSEHNTEDCFRHPDAVCALCHKQGHVERICPEKQSDKGKGGKGAGKGGDKAQKRKEKRQTDQAMIAFAKHHGFENTSAEAHQATLPTPGGQYSLGGAHAALAAPQQPAAVESVMISGALYVKGADGSFRQSQGGQHFVQGPQVCVDSKSRGAIHLFAANINAAGPPKFELPTSDCEKPLIIEPDRDLALEQALPLEAVGEPTVAGSTVMLLNTPDYVQVRMLIDGGSDTTAITLTGNLRGLDHHVLVGAQACPAGGPFTQTAGGTITASHTGTAHLMIGNVRIPVANSELYPEETWGYDIIACETQLEEEHQLYLCKKTDTLTGPDGLSVPVQRCGRAHGPRRKGAHIYIDCYLYVGGNPDVASIHLTSAGKPKSVQDWHEVLGCPGKTTMAKTLSIVCGLPDDLQLDELQPCTWCHQAKDKRQQIERNPDVPPREYGPREAVGMDISSRQTISTQGAQYLQLIVEFKSRYIVGQLLELNSNAAEAFREYCVKYFPPDIVQTDGDGSYEAQFADFCTALQIDQRRSAPNTQAQNYIAEIGMKLVFTCARALLLRATASLLAAGLEPIKFWADAVLCAIDCINVRFTKGVTSGKTPFEEFHGFKPDVTLWQKFGQPAHVLVHHPENKLAPRSVAGIYMRMALGYKAYRIYVPEWDKFVITRHATFDALPAAPAAPDPQVDSWILEGLKEDKGDELFDGKDKGPTSEASLVQNPLPPAKESADLNTRPNNTGTNAKHQEYEEFRRRRFLEHTKAGDSTPGLTPEQRRQEIMKKIGAEWQAAKKTGQQLIPTSGSTSVPRGSSSAPAREEGGVAVTDPEIKNKYRLEPHLNLEPDSEDSDSEQEPNQVKPTASYTPEQKKEHSPHQKAPSPEPAPAEKARPSPAKTRSQAKANINALSKAINVIADTDGHIHHGHFTEESWHAMYALTKDPSTVLQALNGPDATMWRKAIEEELESLIDLQVYERITIRQVPKGKKILSAKVVLKYKEYERRYKARLVVLGFMQSDEDAGETFAPVAKFTTFRLLMAIACALNLDISSSDVKTAFLNAVLVEPIYVYPPRGLGFPRDTVWKLLKNLYGLKGAPRGWNLNLHSFLLEIGFTQSIIDPCLYHIKDLWVLVWVDDTLKVGSPEAIAWFEDQCNQRYTMTHVKETEMFVGIEITRDRENRILELKQTAYFDKILEACGMLEDGQHHNGPPTPMAENTKVTREDCCMGDPKLIAEVKELTEKQGWEYASPAASLLYAAICTRPDLAFTCKEICKVMADPGPKHFSVLKRALKYLRGTKTLGLRYQAKSPEIMDSLTLEYQNRPQAPGLTFEAWCDASFGDDPDTKRSTQGFVAKLCGAAVGWFSQGQKSTSLSTAEAELIALADGIKEILYIREAMTFFGAPQLGPTVVYEDNAAVVATAHNPGKNHGKLKHVAIRTHRVQEEVHLETIDVVHMSTDLMQADILTKALGKMQHKRLAMALLGYLTILALV
jgi:hypothetical protein